MNNIYLFYGEEKYDLNVKVEKIKKEFENLQLGLNLYYLDKDNVDSLSSLCQGVTFFGNEKLIIIKDTKLKFNVEELKDLEEGIKIVIIEESVDKRTSEYKLLSKIAECEEFKYLDSKKMTTYIVQTLKKYDINISYQVAEYMQNVCGEDKSNNINEIQKLVFYVEKGGTVTEDIINKICSKTLNTKIFDVLDNIVNKKKYLAISQLDDLIKQKEPILKIYIMLYKQIKQMYMIKYFKTNKLNINDLSTQMKIHPYTLQKLIKSSENYKISEIKNILYEFDEYDEKTKIGEMDFNIGLKKIILSM